MRDRLRALRRIPLPLAVILVVAAVGHVAWSLATAPLQGPDEDSHVAYVQRMVETGELPQEVDATADGYSSEIDAARRWGNLLAVPTYPAARPNGTELEREAFRDDVERLEGEGREDGTGFQPAAQNAPLYYLYEAIGYVATYPADLFTRIQAMRLMGLPLLLIVVAFTWLLVAELLPRPRWARALAAGLVAVQPVTGFMSGVVNPDIGLAAVWAVFLWAAVRVIRRGPTLRMALLLGALSAASALIQPRGATIGLPALVAFLLASHAHRVSVRDLVRWSAVLCGVAFAGIGLYWYVVKVAGSDVVGGQLSGTVSSEFNVRQFLSYFWQFYWEKLRFMEPTISPPIGYRYVWAESLFGVYGSLDVFFPAWVLNRIHQGTLYGFVALIVCAIIRSGELRRRWRELTALVVAAVTLVVTLHVGAYAIIRDTEGETAVLVGRYLLPLMPLLGLAVAFVATTLPRGWGRGFGALSLAVMALLQVGALGLTVARYYG